MMYRGYYIDYGCPGEGFAIAFDGDYVWFDSLEGAMSFVDNVIDW